MALPSLLTKLFKNDGYGPEIRDERLSTDITVKDWDASHDYPANVLAKAGGDIYRSVAASGPGTSAGAVNPTQDASAVYWEVFGKGGSVPVGTVVWLSTAAVPVGFLLCNGQAVGRAAYPDLFDAIGTAYGAGDGSTTFNLPNLIGKFIEGANSNIGDSVAAGLPNITGTFEVRRAGPGDTNIVSSYNAGGTNSVGVSLTSGNVWSSSCQTVSNTKNAKTDVVDINASRSSAIYGNSSTVQPPAVKLLPCIKAYSGVDNLGSLDVAQLENYVQNNCVHKTGNETIAGEKTFTGDIILGASANYNLSTLTYDPDVAPQSDKFRQLTSVKDINGITCADIYTAYTTGRAMQFVFRVSSIDHGTTAYLMMSAGYNNGLTNATIKAGSLRPSTNGGATLGQGDRRWGQIYSTSSTISTSDARLKTEPQAFPDEVLDAWGDVEFVQFQMLDSVAKKGPDAARLHSGLIAQRIDEAFKSRGLDASCYGLFCHDEWEAEPEERDEQGNVISPAKPAGDEFSLRYEEALCMEAAYQRRRAGRAEARIAALEARLAALAAKLNG